jgi:hypothetical protein
MVASHLLEVHKWGLLSLSQGFTYDGSIFVPTLLQNFSENSLLICLHKTAVPSTGLLKGRSSFVRGILHAQVIYD